MNLPILPPFPPMDAKSVARIPAGDRWLYEPKWDGFRCLAFRDGDEIALQSKAGQPLARYFPELVDGLKVIAPARFVFDGEIVIAVNGKLSFDALLMRIHPAEKRVRKLASEIPARLFVFVPAAEARSRLCIYPNRRLERSRRAPRREDPHPSCTGLRADTWLNRTCRSC